MPDSIPITACFARLMTETELKRLRQIVLAMLCMTGAGNDGGSVALDKQRGRLLNDTALIYKQGRMGRVAVSSRGGTLDKSERAVSASGR